jgi:hypothetical protein
VNCPRLVANGHIIGAKLDLPLRSSLASPAVYRAAAALNCSIADRSLFFDHDSANLYRRVLNECGSAIYEAPDYGLARQVANLWPHRKHESPALMSLLCAMGIHYWRSLNLRDLYPGKTIHHCFWCSKVRVDGIIYDI